MKKIPIAVAKKRINNGEVVLELEPVTGCILSSNAKLTATGKKELVKRLGKTLAFRFRKMEVETEDNRPDTVQERAKPA